MSARDPLAPLRRDVDLLATTLGTTLVEQEGQELLDAVERVRLLARAAREGGGEAERQALRAAVREIDGPLRDRVVRAFAFFFVLVNLAEQHHRLRRLRARAAAGEPHPRVARRGLRARAGGRRGGRARRRAAGCCWSRC